MDDEDGRCLLDVICDPQALNDFLHGSETQLDTDDLLDGSSDPSSSFFSSTGGHVPEVQPQAQLSTNEPGLPRVSVDLDFLEDDILGGSPGGDNGSNGVGTNHEPCDILQQSLAEANITEQSLQEADAELDLSQFGLTGLTQVVQPLPDAGLSGVGIGGATQIFSNQGTSTAPSNATQDMLSSVLAHPGLQLQSQVMNKAISVQPFVQQVGLGNVTLQPISSLQALPNGSQSGPLGIGQIQVVGQPTVMTINPSGQQILAKTMGGYQLHQPGPEAASAGTQGGLGGSVLSSGGGLLIQGGKATLGSPALNGPAVCLSNTNTNNSSTTMATAGGIVGFGNASLGAGIGSQTQPQGQIMQNVIIQRTPTPIQPKPPQGGAIQPKVFKQQQQLPAPHALPNDTNKALGVQQIPVSAGQNVTFLGKPGSNVVLSTQATSQGTQFSQALFKQQGPQTSGKPLSVHLLNQQGSIVIPSQTVLQSQNHQFLLPGLQAGGQILTQHPGGHIITSQGPGGQIIANQILTANQNINLGQMLASQGHPGAAHILSGHIQLQPGQMGQPTLFQMPVSLAQTQTQAHPVTGHVQTVIQGMPIQNSLSVESLSPAVSLQTLQQSGGIPNNSNSGSTAMAPCQPGEGITVLGGSTDPAAQSAQTQLQPSILTVQTTPQVSVAASVPSSSSPSPTMVTSTSSMVGLGPQAQHSPGKVLFTSPGSSMILSQESLQMFLQQDQQQQAGKDPPAAVGVPASVIVSGSSSGPAPSGHDNLLAETRQRQSPSPSLGPAHMATVVNKVPSAAHSQSIKIQSASPSQPVVTPAPTPTLTDSPQPAQASPITIGQQIQSPHQHQQSRPPSQPQPQSQAQTPSRSCTPSSLPPLFIIHNQIGGSPQPPQQQQQQQPQQVQVQLQPQVLPQPTALQPDIPPSSCSPKPPQPLPAQFQFQPVVSSPPAAVVKQQVTVVPGLTAEQQHHLQLVSAQLQTMSSITQPSPQQKQLLEKLHQVQQNIFLQAKQQAQAQVQAQAQASQQQATNQFNKMPDHHSVQAATSTASVTIQAPVQSLLQQKSVLVKSSTTGANDTQVFSAGATVNQGITTPNLAQAVQAKPGVISSVGGLTLSKAGLQIQVLGTALSQMSAPTPPALQTQTSTLKRPFSLEPSKEARMLEQLRKQQGSVLHPDYSSPFHSFEDKLHRLLPYHLYQGMASSPEDYRKVDDEFENVSCQLLKRTQAMVDKYRHLLFEESKQRLGPSAEMVMIDRMFIQEEKVALNQDRVLAKEKPEEFVANSCLLDSSVVRPVKVELSSVRTASSSAAGAGQPVAATPPPAAAVAPAPTPTPAPTPAAAPTPASTPALFPPTKLVIKQGGRGASVSWSTSSTPTLAPVVRPSAEPVTPSASFSRTPSSRPADDDDDVALPQRTSKPPIKTYEARQRIGLKLKIKQEAGFSKVVHNTALDPVHSQSQLTPQPPTPEQPQKVKPTHVTPPITVIRTPPPTSYTTPSSTVTTVTTHTGSASSSATSSSGPTPSFSSSWSSSSPSTSTAQMNGTLEHHEVGGVKRNPASTATPPLTTCRLPLRKTYRENISPRRRPGVPGGGGDMLPIVPAGPPITSSPQPQGSSPQPERTVIASVKLERQGGHGQSHPHAESQSLAAVEDVLYRGIKNAYQHHRDFSDKEDEVEAEKGGGLGRLKGIGSKNREGGRGTFRMDQHAPGPPSPGESSCTRDSTLPAKRCKSDSPDMDNASFSSGSPPPDDSLNEHLQCAIDSILNLQQGPPGHGGSGKGALGRVHGENLPNQHQTHPSYRQSMPPLSTPTSSTPMSQHPQVGGRGQNGNLVSQTHSR
ncbi:glioma tumor suppressor candidate region gene 1 protein-like isoform X1 [Sinocyclocheilus grahami]|uniref:glioma tumor suppressor candidate region gene 1 protein-like isoform X1 n=1 Tax=Sinocyclocheilus grahami TaxID=75366 RepID=UPI0007ACCEEA|nr:PREDICTED: glioma tumor suppressor candidate region gene 1 protein-like isoform X1 [Sinocyclocheilus grahami]XP_016105769.1 PREDICTED: glioma tumor suppressor candidate region gene 1 protein-like isoform X1 [Sinocyclocheilus grahami]